MYQYLSKPEPYQPQFQALGYFGPNWWFALHMIQTPMVSLVAVGLWLVADRVNDSAGTTAMALAWLSRAATLVFLIFYTALDAIGGIGLGRSMLTVESLAASGQLNREQVDGVVRFLNVMWTDPWVGGVDSFISETGSRAVFVAALAAAIGLFLSRSSPLAAAPDPGCVRLGTSDEPCQPAWPDRIRSAHHCLRLALVGTATRHCVIRLRSAPYPVPPRIIPTDRPPQRLGTSEPATHRKPARS